jgi:hypothetical protein
MRIEFQLTVERPSLPRTRPGRLFVVSVLALALAIPPVALGVHLFNDVPTGSTFHDNITNLANAGVTTGCDDFKYCPADPVTRAQVAAFLNRGLGRIAEGDFQKAVTGTASSTIGTFTITPGTSPNALDGANQFLKATYQGTVRFSNVTSCPCSVAIYLTANGSSFSNFATATTISATNTYAAIVSGGALPILGAEPVTIAAVAYLVTGGGATTAYTMFGNVTVETFPFGGSGGDTLEAAPAPAGDDPLAVPAGR